MQQSRASRERQSDLTESPAVWPRNRKAMVECLVKRGGTMVWQIQVTLAAIAAACFLTADLMEPHLAAKHPGFAIVSYWLGSLVACYVRS
jgi:hypothetical protein